MSLIACTSNYKVPFMLGDLLITSNEPRENIQLPTNAMDIKQYLRPNDYVPSGLYQKIYIIKANVCIALAGNVYEMTCFLEEFKLRCSYYDPVQESHIRTFIEEYDYNKSFSQSAFFIMSIEHEGENSINVKQFWYPPEKWDYVESDVFESAYACGSGKADFLKQTGEKTKFESSSEKGEIGRAIASNIGFIARLLAVERVSLNTINKNWGGGFETMFYNGKSFEKFDQIAYVLNEGQFDEAGEIGLPVPRMILHYRYHNDLLLISCIEIQKCVRQDFEKTITVTSNEYKADLYIVSQLDRKTPITREELPKDFSFQTNCIALGYALMTASGTIYGPSFFSESKDLRVIFKDKESIEIKLHTEINDMIRSGAKSAYPNL